MPPKQKQPAAGCEFEYCDVCRRNHDQGRRHRYFPAHRAALTAVLSRFRSKLSALRVSLLRPSPPRPDLPHRLWCPFCSADLLDLSSRFACSNAVYHLASRVHLDCVKDFMRKHGGGIDQIDSLRISEAELAKWEKDCESLDREVQTLTEGMIGPSPRPLNDIRNESTTKNLDNFAENDTPSFRSTASYVVMPLQSPTNGAYHPTSTACTGTSTSGSVPYSAPLGTYTPLITQCGSISSQGQQGMLDIKMFVKGGRSTSVGNGTKPSVSCSGHNGVVQQSHFGGNFNEGLKANVHNGAPPPWLEASEDETCLSKKASLSSYALPSSHKGKSRKLNPKRVGAAWAEKRRAEMEAERRGELVPETSDASWLPNFGRVWQSGTRKESRKEFEKKHKLDEKDSHHELSSEIKQKDSHHESYFEIKPYLSKRMRAGSNTDGQLESLAEE